MNKIPINTLLFSPYRCDFSSKVDQPTRDPDFASEGLKIWLTDLGVIAYTRNFHIAVNHLLLRWQGTRKIFSEPICAIALWQDVKAYKRKVYSHQRFYLMGVVSPLSLSVIVHKLILKLLTALSLYQIHVYTEGSINFLIGRLSRQIWDVSGGAAAYLSEDFLYILKREQNSRCSYYAVMTSSEFTRLVECAYTKQFDKKDQFIDICQRLGLIEDQEVQKCKTD